MKERPVLFSGPMVRAILEGRKTQTRRVVKVAPFDSSDQGIDVKVALGNVLCPYGVPGDRLWVRETFFYATGGLKGGPNLINYRATDDCKEFDGLWRPSIFMPRAASRITLEITNVRVQRVQEISESDAESEGVGDWEMMGGTNLETAQSSFSKLWDFINAKRGFGWDKNPWVWALTFMRVV